VELAQPAPASQVLMGITVWAAVAPTLEHSRSAPVAPDLDFTILAVWGPAMGLACHVQATVAPPGITV